MSEKWITQSEIFKTVLDIFGGKHPITGVNKVNQQWNNFKRENPDIGLFPRFEKFIISKYWNRDILYHFGYVYNFYLQLVYDNFYELKKAENAYNLIKNNEITLDKLGTIADSTFSSDDTDADSYVGFNVDSNFQKNTSQSRGTSNRKYKNIAKDIHSFTTREAKAFYEKLGKEFEVVLRGIY